MEMIVSCATGEESLVPSEPRKMTEEPLRPLGQVGALATLLAVTETLTVTDAANAVGLTPADLVNEAEAWKAAADQ